MSAATDIPALEHKAIAASPESGLLAANDETGVVEAIVSVTGIPDEVKDIIEPGAYADTLAKRRPKGIFAHDWHKWVARTEDIKELMPGDPQLPKAGPDGKPWPGSAGGLYVKCRFNLGTREGQDAYSNVKFFSETGECQWSIGYKVPPGKGIRTKDGYRRCRAIDLFEYSPVLFGAAPLSGTLTVKAMPDGTEAMVDEGVTTDAGDPDEDLITQAADEDDPDATALHADAIAEMNATDDGWDAIDAASMIDPGEEDLNDVDAGTAAPDNTKALQAKDGNGSSGNGSSSVSDTPWSQFTPADYSPAQWHKACLIHMHPPGQVPDDKEHCKLPVREPDGTLNRNGVHAAAGVLAGARGGVNASPGSKKMAAQQLRGLYKRIGDTPPASLQSKALILAALASPPPPAGGAVLQAASTGRWTGHPDDYTLTQWHDATLVHEHPDGEMPTSKHDCGVPVTLPDGQLDADGMAAAATTLAGSMDTGPRIGSGIVDARAALAHLFRRAGVSAPDGLLVKVAGQEVTPGDVRATDRLKNWYEHGPGGAQIGWGVPGDFMRCVAIAGKHMDPAKAKGYCQLRHKGATGFYAGHAPAEVALHAAAEGARDAMDDSGQSKAQPLLFGDDAGGYGDSGLFDGAGAGGVASDYDPMLENGPYAGVLPAQANDLTAGAWPQLDDDGDYDGDDDGDGGGQQDDDDSDMEPPLEETLDKVASAVTAALTQPGPNGMPRHLVTVNGTWPGHVIATRIDTLTPGDDGESFDIPWNHDGNGGVQLGDPVPVLLTVGSGGPRDDRGKKSLGGTDEDVSALPLIVEHVTGVIRRGLQVKEGRVLSTANVTLLRGAVGQLLSVLRSAGIPVDQTASDTPDDDEQNEAQAGAEPMYLPDSTAPAAQVGEQTKVMLDPALVARAYRVTAAAHAAAGEDSSP